MNKTGNNNSRKQRQPKKRVELIDLTSFSIQQLMEKAIRAYQQNDINSEDKWNAMLTKSGTKKDKISAAGLLILQNPQSCLKYFDLFIKWCFDKNHNFAICACEGLANVYSQHIFVQNSSLNDFTDSVQNYIRNNKKNCQVSNAELISFYLQSEIKQHYSEFIKAIQLLLGSQLNHIKKICIKILGNLAKHKQLRRTILALIINKLGDTDMDVVNQVSKCLKQQFYQDLLASEVLMEETQRFLFRPNLPQKAQFFVINFLNNINLKFLNEKSLNKIFQIFYHFFTKSVSSDQNSDELGSRLFLNSLKGLNRVFAFMKGGSKQTKKNISQKIEDVYRIIHITPNVKAKIQLLLFLFQSHAHLQGNISSNNRFYRTLYEFISKDQVMNTSLSEMFFDLILVCIKQDQNLNRILAMIKRMLQLCFGANSNFIVTTLLMLDKIIQQKQGLKITLQKEQKMLEDQMQTVQKYDINKRDPLYSGAQSTCVWQLRCFCSHYHPTVRKFAQSILSNTPINYEGNNPLLQFNLTSFIQKLSLRKQRKSEAWRIKVKRNLSKIRTSKYRTLLDKELQTFNQDEQFIKKYLQIRNVVHKSEKKAQSNDIQQYADQVIEKQMDRLNPRQADQQLSITPVESDFEYEEQNSFDQFENQENQNEVMQDQNQQFDEEMQDDVEDFGSEEFDQDENPDEEKQFQDVFNQIQEDDENQGVNKRKQKKGFGRKTKTIQKGKQRNNKNWKKNQKPNLKNRKNGYKK